MKLIKIISHKLRYLIAVVLLLWLLILVKHLSNKPIKELQIISGHRDEVSVVVDIVPPSVDGDKVPDVEKDNKKYVIPPHRLLSELSSLSMPVNQPASPSSRVASLPIPEDIDMSEVNFKDPMSIWNDKAVSKSGPLGVDKPDSEKQDEIVQSFMHAWSAYKKYAWGFDELRPLSRSGSNWMDVGLTIVDSLDTMYIMGLKEEFELAKKWVVNELSPRKSSQVQLFEIVIRLLGGLLSAFHLSGDSVFLNKAKEYGEILNECLKGPTPLPCHKIDLSSGKPVYSNTNLAEIGTIQLEFRDLSRATGNSEYEERSFAVSEYLHSLEKYEGLLPSLFMIGMQTPSSVISMGGQSDSYYEYLLKQWLQTGKTKEWLRKDYEDAINGAKKHLMKRSSKLNNLYLGQLSQGGVNDAEAFVPVMEHLACFLPGTLALGYMNGLPSDHLDMAKALMSTCLSMYSLTPLNLSPESVNFGWVQDENHDFSIESSSAYNIHRPETIESLFYLYRATNDSTYKTSAWKIFEAFEKHTKLSEGYAGIQRVDVADHKTYIDKLETFYLAETLKYLFLMFSDRKDLLPLDKWVFNTEAHPLPIYTH